MPFMNLNSAQVIELGFNEALKIEKQICPISGILILRPELQILLRFQIYNEEFS